MNLKSIKEDVVNEIIINKSRFITVLCKVYNNDEVLEKIEYFKNKYKDATHYCTGYIINSYMKCDDDGEPSGTAGMPILNVLKKNNLNFILCIVIRYFGGIKLGAGGLVRAYSRSASEAINKSEIVNLVNGYIIKIEFNYDNTKLIDNYLKNIDIKKEFDEKVSYTFKISNDDFENIKNILEKNTNILKKEPILLAV